MSTYYIPDDGDTALTMVGKAMCLQRFLCSVSFYLLCFLPSSATCSSRTYFAYVFKSPFNDDLGISKGQKPHSKGQSTSHHSELTKLLAGMDANPRRSALPVLTQN